MSTFFRNALLVQLDPAWVERGNLRVADGKIAGVGQDIAAEPGDEIVECDGAVLMPGLVNGHTHLYSALAAGMPAPPRQPRNFHEILQFIWWRLDRAHTLESVEVSGQIGALAALRCGTTTLIDHHASPNAIDGSLTALEKGIAAVGLRGVLCYEVTDRNGEQEGVQGLAENERYAVKCASRDGSQFSAMLGAHASFTLEEETLEACVRVAKKLGIGIHIHVAEDPIDERITFDRFGCGLFERFERVGLFTVPGTLLAHGTHLSEADWSLVDLGENFGLVHNPSSNMNNGVGYTPVAKLRLPCLLGTDGIGADMWREARVAEFKSRDAALPLPFGTSLEMLAMNARLASNWLVTTLGELQIGAEADLVLTHYRPATPLTAENLAGHFLFTMGSEFVRDVMVGGKWLLRDGMVVSCDERVLRCRSIDVARNLHTRMAEIPC